MKQRIITEEEKDAIAQAYRNNELLKDIAAKHNVSVSTVSEIARRRGIPKRDWMWQAAMRKQRAQKGD